LRDVPVEVGRHVSEAVMVSVCSYVSHLSFTIRFLLRMRRGAAYKSTASADAGLHTLR
jgi:hypothetical protein